MEKLKKIKFFKKFQRIKMKLQFLVVQFAMDKKNSGITPKQANSRALVISIILFMVILTNGKQLHFSGIDQIIYLIILGSIGALVCLFAYCAYSFKKQEQEKEEENKTEM